MGKEKGLNFFRRLAKQNLNMHKGHTLLVQLCVAGEFDIVARVQVKSLEKLLKVTDKIQMIKGVNKTTTQVIEKEITL